MTRMTSRIPSEAGRLREYERWAGGSRPSSLVLRWAMGRLGTFAVNTPVFRLKENLRLEPWMRVLDVGCGRGTALRLLDERVRLEHPPVGLDFSRPSLALARNDQRGAERPIELARGTASALPFADGSFDIVICGLVLKHLDDDEARGFFEELRRVLTAGGLALLWEFAPTGNPRLDHWNEWFLSRGVEHPRLRSTRALMGLGEVVGFEYIREAKLRPFLLPPIPRASVLLGKPPEGWDPHGAAGAASP